MKLVSLNRLRGIGLAAVITGCYGSPALAAGILTQGGTAGIAPVAAGMTASLAAAQQAQAVAVQAQNQLSRITTALQAMQTMQSAARSLAVAAPSGVPDGLQTGGLVPDSGLAAPGVAKPVADWTGAQTPVQSSSAGKTNVTINQTAAQAILSWNSFNVGKSTSVDFNQQGHANWVALNQIAASGVPSQILGSIKADGQVYLINPNGIIFGGASQVNVGALIASSATLSSSQFLANGIYSPQTNLSYAPSFTNAGGLVTVQAGAQITTNAPASVTTGGGFVLLLGTQVQNAGAITTPNGQAELAAGDNFLLRPGFGTATNAVSTTRGNEVAVRLKHQGSSTRPGGSGLVDNTGVITADTGDITLAGETVVQDGQLLATTSVDVRGTIHLLSSATNPLSSVTLTGNSLTLISPDLASGAKALDSQRAALIASSAVANAERNQLANANFNDLGVLADRQDESRVEIVTGGTATFAGNSQTVATGGQIAVSAAARVLVNAGAILDVAGSYGVALPASSNDILVNIQSFELRDNPQNRLTGALRNNTVFVDARTLSLVPASPGAYPTDRYYTQSGLLEVSGYLNNTAHGIGEWTALGGSISLAAGASGAVLAQHGAVFDIAGGSINYQSGELPQSYLLGSDGRVYNANNAPGNVTYLGVYDGFVVDHAHWGVSQTYGNGLKTPAQVFQPGYTVGRAAGTLAISAPTAIFNGTIEAGAVNGAGQIAAAPAGVSDPYTLKQNVVAAPGSLVVGSLVSPNLFPSLGNVQFVPPPVPDLAGKKIPQMLQGASIFDAAALSSFGLGGISVLTQGSIDVTAPLTLAPGAAVSLFGSSINVAANITAAGGSVSMGNIANVAGTTEVLQSPDPPFGKSATGSIVLAANTAINTAGLWTNLARDPAITFTQAFINGGPVSLVSVNSLKLGTGSLIDASAGAVVAANGSRNGGGGGAITLDAAVFSGAAPLPTDKLVLDGQLQSRGFTSGGALTLMAPTFQIASGAPPIPGTVTLDPAFFTAGFSAYNLVSNNTVKLASGTIVNVVEPTYQFSDAAAALPTGANPAAGFTLALLPLYTANPALTGITQRPGASFSIVTSLPLTLTPAAYAGIDLNTGAAINVDPGQAIHLEAYGEMIINGSLTAPGGSIVVRNDAVFQTLLPGGPGALSIWFGPDSVLNANAQAFTATNAIGDSISAAPAGGSITIGGTNTLGQFVSSTTASIIIRQGAVIEASGTAATDRLVPRSPLDAAAANAAGSVTLPVQTAGGAISLSSQNGIFNDGVLRAAAGGANAAGGSLFMALETDQINNAAGFEAAPRVLIITQTDTAPPLPATLQPGENDPGLLTGTGRISAAQITTGGFGAVTLFARDALVFDGNVNLQAPQSISLLEGAMSERNPRDSVTITAPYVLLSGQTPAVNQRTGAPVTAVNGYSTQPAAGSFTVNAALLDIANGLRFGGVASVLSAQGVAGTLDLPGFAVETLNSTGDLRFLPPQTNPDGTGGLTDLITTANLTLNAGRIYAMGSTGSASAGGFSGTAGVIIAGYNPAGAAGDRNGSFFPDKTLTITRSNTLPQTAPLVIGGSLTFDAANISQGGVIWQPLGSITFGDIGQFIGNSLPGAGDPRATVNILPGSLTSVSAAGLTVPFGGTTDGVTYNVDGLPIAGVTSANFGLPAVAHGATTGQIYIAARVTNIATGAVLDLGGGGTLTGAGYISGQSGSTDPLATPLLRIAPNGAVSQPSLAASPVYAIIPGPQPVAAVAYTESGTPGSVAGVGAQIIIPAGVPGLPAGRYTLLPSAYALAPGGYRVEFDGTASLAAPAVAPLTNGSYAVAGRTAVANTNVLGSLPVSFTITPAVTLRNYGQYDEQGYSPFLLANAALIGAVRPVLPVDAGTLILNLPGISSAAINNTGLTMFQPATGGIGGTLQISGAPFGTTPSLDIYGAQKTPDLPAGTVSLSAASIDAFNAFTLELGIAGAGFQADTTGVTLENGATLTAARVVITALTGGITLLPGSGIDTLGFDTLLSDSTTAGLYNNGGASVLDVGNGYISYGPSAGGYSQYGPVTIDSGAKIYTDGSIAFSTGGAVNIGAGASYGGKYLDLAVPEINVGDAVAARATAPPGLTLTQAVLQNLTGGVPAIGLPPVQILVLSASSSLNFYGTTALDLSGGNVQLVIDSPAIYGFGAAGDAATITAGTIVWNGISTIDRQTNAVVSSLPGGTVLNGPGSGAGTLNFDAGTIILGYSNLDQPQRGVKLNRLALGFGTVNLNASSEITANNQGTLSVYQSQAVFGAPGTGGNLNLNTPLLTAGNQAIIGFTAGGTLQTGPAPGAAAPPAGGQAAGGEIDLTAAGIGINGAVLLPSGRLNLQSAGNITLGSGAAISLAGLTTHIFDQTIYGFGGDFIAESATGGITQNAGSGIDVSAVNNNAGSITLTATSGQVALGGILSGTTSGNFNSGSFALRARTIPDFAALNATLDAGGIDQSRSFDLKTGDLTVGNGVQAHTVSISVDAGSLTVAGLINASGGGAGSISLAAGNNLTLTGGAVLDAQGTVLATDSYGQPIEAANAPAVSLTTSNGELLLAGGATINMASADSVARGDLELNVPRLGGVTSGDANIAVQGSINITGAATIAVNAFATYHGLADPTGTTTGAPDALITQAYLDQINSTDTQPFMAAALTDGDLVSRLGVLRTTYAANFHFRPGVDIISATPTGDLTVQGDINLAGYGYGPGVNPAVYGSGEPGVLVIRAGGNLNIYGSITDGFAPPISDAGTGFANGWQLYGAGGEPYGQNVVLPTTVIVAPGSEFAAGGQPVNFPLPITGGSFQAGAVAPVALTVSGPQLTTFAFVATSDITAASGAVLFAKGAVVPANSVLPNRAVIAAGGTLPISVNVGPVVWPANTPFTIIVNGAGFNGVITSQAVTLLPGSFIPAPSVLKFPKGEPGLNIPVQPNGQRLFFTSGSAVPATFNTRPAGADGTQGQLYAIAPLLPAGDLSWSIRLVAGADTGAADTGVVQAVSSLAASHTAGNLTLADTHYGTTVQLVATAPPRLNPNNPKNAKACARAPALCEPTYAANEAVVPAFSVVRTGTGTLDLLAGGSITENSSYGVYTAGAQSAPILDAGGGNPYNLPQGQIAPNNTLLGTRNANLAALVANYQANYPTGGGNVLVSAQGDLNAYILAGATLTNQNFYANGATDTDAIGGWLWRQGGAGQPGAWWIEYGAFEPSIGFSGPVVGALDGFQGVGTLGGGNLTVAAGGNASGLNLVVASSGRVQADGTLLQTGGGNLNVKIGGAVNFVPPDSFNNYLQDAGGLISDLRGNTSFSAGSIGTIFPIYGLSPVIDPRVLPPLTSETSLVGNGIDLAPGDGTVTVTTRGDLVIDGAANPGIVQNLVNTTPVSAIQNGKVVNLAGNATSYLSLWTQATGIGLFSAGGDIAPSQGNNVGSGQNATAISTTNSPNLYPPNLSVIAQNGNIQNAGFLELASAPSGQLQLLAANSISGGIIAISGAALSADATPFNPAITVVDNGTTVYTNFSPNANSGGAALAEFGADTPSGALHANDPQPALIYAGTRDILDMQFGLTVNAGANVTPSIQYVAAKPFDVIAGRDIVDSGSVASPSVFLNLAPGDVTTFTAGRDILQSSIDIAGPGNLVVQAGRNINQADQGTIYSIGPIFNIDPTNRNSGAGISVLAGVGPAGPDYTGFGNLFLNPASRLGLQNAAQILQASNAALLTWLQTSYGYTGPAGGAYAFFQKLSAQQQNVFRRDLYFQELNASGLEFNNPASPRYKSYILGRDAIAALFPVTGTYAGDLTLYGNSGIHTQFGGAIETLTPGGQTIIGVEGASPPGSAGFITQGSGDIDIFAHNSVLLGESRVLTTFGGNIVIWSATGDINAGRGSKTTVDYTPLQRVYDVYGNISLSPTVPSSGAGIATLNPIPQVPAGNINLVAPLGTVDAGEAGIRVSGNLNIAALHVLNIANIVVQGTTTGVPVNVAPNVGALTTAGNAAGAAVQAAENAGKPTAPAPLPSIWIVEVLGYGGGDGGSNPAPCPPARHGQCGSARPSVANAL